jgi:uncharacterized protein involved in exopolysaccharide biosynthesis
MAQGPTFDFDEIDEDAEPGEARRPKLKDWLVLLMGAALRRKVLFLAVLVAGMGAVVTYYMLKTPVYRVEAKILAQRQQVLPSTLRGAADDNPTRTAWELIHRRENLIALVKAGNLLDGAAAPKPRRMPSLRRGDAEPVDPMDQMVKVLDRMLVVFAEEGTINISLDWPDANQAYRIVDAALQNFVEARHVQEVTAIDEVLSVLRARAAKAREDLDRVTDDVRREVVEGTAKTTGAPRPAVRGTSEELVRLKSLLESKVRAIQDVEDFRRRRLADLHAQLDEKRNTYSDAHPAVIQLRQDIDALSRDSSQVDQLRLEEQKLRQEYQAKLAQEGVPEPDPASATVRASAPRGLPRSNTPVEDDERVRDARFQYQQIVERVNVAQLELDAVRAAFKYRYNVIWPPQIPKDPVSPNPKKIFGAGSIAALLLALLAAAAPDLRSGRILQRWQVERGLGLPILAEFNRR